MEKFERNRRMKQCANEKFDLQLILDEYSWIIINELSQTTCVPLQYIFLTTIVSLCHWSMSAFLEGAQGYKVPLILFGILSGGSGSKKSAPIRMIKESCEAVETLDGIPVKNSSINASVNMESLCCELERKPNIVQLWDEISVFLGLFGSTRVDRAGYDRGLMCEFYSPTGMVKRQLVSRCSIMINPRLNLVAAGQPKRTIECLIGQENKESNEDGLFNRFLIAVAYKNRPVRDRPEKNEQIPTLSHLFYLTKKLHDKFPQEYHYKEDAKNFIRDEIYNYDLLSSDKSNDDDFLASSYQKSMEKLERLTLVLHIFKITSNRLFAMVNSLSSFKYFDEKFKLTCANEELHESDLYIDYDTCFRASLLTKYYLNQMKILAGYDPITDVFVSNKKNSVELPEAEIKHVKEYIERHPADRLLLSSLPANLKRKITKDQYLSILRVMEQEGIGTIEETNNSTGPKAIVFVKKRKLVHQNNEASSTIESNQ